MSEELDRGKLIGLLDKLGGGGDEDVLSAAPTIHTQVSASGQTWDQLLTEPEIPDTNWDTAEEADEEKKKSPEEKATGNREALSLIIKLLAKPDLYEGTRQELEGYKEDIAAGEFTGADHKYLHALRARTAIGK